MTNNEKCDHGLANAFTYLLIGGGIGATLALLFAPKSGNALRGDIADVTRKGYGAAIDKANDLKAQSAEVIQTVKEKAEAAYDFASDRILSSSEAVADAVSSTTGAVADGIEQMRNESSISSKQAGNGRKGSNIV